MDFDLGDGAVALERLNPELTDDAYHGPSRGRRRHVVTVAVELRNQDDTVMAEATVEVELPGADG